MVQTAKYSSAAQPTAVSIQYLCGKGGERGEVVARFEFAPNVLFALLFNRAQLAEAVDMRRVWSLTKRWVRCNMHSQY